MPDPQSVIDAGSDFCNLTPEASQVGKIIARLTVRRLARKNERDRLLDRMLLRAGSLDERIADVCATLADAADAWGFDPNIFSDYRAHRTTDNWLRAIHHIVRLQSRADLELVMQTRKQTRGSAGAPVMPPSPQTVSLPTAPATPPAAKPGEAARRSMTQSEVDTAIREYRASCAGRYNEIRLGVERGDKAAGKAARRLFGRNALHRTIGCKSTAMVSKSSAYRAIASELQLEKKRAGSRCGGGRVGVDLAVDQASAQTGDSTASDVEYRDTLAFIQKHLPLQRATLLIEKLDLGEITADQAEDTVRRYIKSNDNLVTSSNPV